MNPLVKNIAKELHIHEFNAMNAIKLLYEEACTIPFIARYRKEVTGSMDEVTLRNLRDRFEYMQELETTKAKYMKVVEEHCKSRPELAIQWPKLREKFIACQTKQELEDLYLPFKPKRRTRATIAKEKGLEALLEKILEGLSTITDLNPLGQGFVTPADATCEEALKVNSAEEALQGAAAIYSERISETPEWRSLIREQTFKIGYMVAKKNETPLAKPSIEDASSERGPRKKDSANKYENYYSYREPLVSAAAHRVMAVRRGEAEKILRVSIEADDALLCKDLLAKVLEGKAPTPCVRQWIVGVVEDAYKRLLSPSVETEIRLNLKTRSESEAIKVFSTNLEKLLLLPPIPQKTVMGIDPGLRTGSKLAVISSTGKMQEYATIYPQYDTNNPSRNQEPKDVLVRLIKTHNVGCLAIGNGTGSREIDQFVIQTLKENNIQDVKRVVVNEAGASVYSTDDIAREEFPDLDPTIRSAISIARRLQDPLAELVKIDPKSIGVGQYQHDCNATKLSNSLKETVESCVNRVGVNLNTASYKLLSYVSGIGASLSKNVVSFRDENGPFKTRDDLMKVSGFGNKTFEQAAGFLRIPDSPNPLDNSAVHPESYKLVDCMAKDLGVGLNQLIGKQEVVNSLPLEKYVTEQIGLPTLLDIAKELIKPGRDPREDGARLMFSDSISTMEDLEPGMKLQGTVTNVTNFGAFVDIGVHQDGLIHISELADEFVRDPSQVVAVGKVLDVTVLDVDLAKRRISLSAKKNPGQPLRQQQQQQQSQGNNRPQQNQQNGNRSNNNFPPRRNDSRGNNQPARSNNKPAPQKSFSMDDLLSKFNSRA